MTLKHLPPGRDVPNDINVVIEIPSNSGTVKYEVDKATGTIMVDRFLGTSMVYPCEYGFIPNTLSQDGDPVDVLVVSPESLFPGTVIRCRPIGLLRMSDESGKDAKILAVPVQEVSLRYTQVEKPNDLGAPFIAEIEHFFKHYKELDADKWVNVE